MSKTMYCIGKIHRNLKEYIIAENNDTNTPAKRVNIVSLRMVKEASILYSGRKISTPYDAVEIAKTFLDGADREQLIMCTLDTKNQPTSISIVSIGSLNSSIVHPREVFKTAIMANASAIIIFHNHPSGDTSPSNEDIETTKRLNECAGILGIKLLDHIIIGDDDSYCSLKERGII